VKVLIMSAVFSAQGDEADVDEIKAHHKQMVDGVGKFRVAVKASTRKIAPLAQGASGPDKSTRR
jgi:hypothetical protein